MLFSAPSPSSLPFSYSSGGKMPHIGTSEGAKTSAKKAKKILEDGSVRGHKLTAKQKRYFGLIAGGGTPRK